MNQTERRRLRKVAKETLERLQETFKLPFPVQLRWNKTADANRGESYTRVGKHGRRGYIGIGDSEQGFNLEQIVCHEYAHLMTWDYPGNDNDAVWVVAYRECYHEIFGGH